jgi:alkane 1-monooxygenase
MMFAAIVSVVFLALFTTMPLVWLTLGAPWMTLVVSFVAIPIIDAVVGARAGNVFARLPPGLARWVPRSQLLFQAHLLALAVLAAPELSAAQLLVFAVAVGTVTGGLGITIAHELGHRDSILDRIVAKGLLVSVCYGHFFVEHIRGHHVRVATPEDPASAPRGMNVYRFLVRSIIGSLQHAWRLEGLRLGHEGRSVWGPSNWVLSGSCLALVIAGATAAVAGANGVVLFVAQAIWAVTLLETINYIEHYGLCRRRDGSRYEPVGEQHSWNADYTISNWILFNLQLHPDHHAHVQRPYESLRSTSSAPQLPAGYPTLVPVALVPPLWFALMERRLPGAGAAA